MPPIATFTFLAMGSECTLHLPPDAEIAEYAEAEVERIEHRYSRYRADSVLSEINRVAEKGGEIALDDETAALMDHAFACHRRSDGRFDLTTGLLRRVWDFSSGKIPAEAEVERLLPKIGMEKINWVRPTLSFPTPGMELDLGGIGKEHAVDCMARICRDAGLASGLIDFGGDLFALGPAEPEKPWLVRVRNPNKPTEPIAMVPLAQGGLATSGDYERGMTIEGKRYGHIFDPRSGWPVQGLASVSVAAASCLLAGSLSTIAMLKGREGPRWLERAGVDCFWVDAEGRCGGSLAQAC